MVNYFLIFQELLYRKFYIFSQAGLHQTTNLTKVIYYDVRILEVKKID